ncbi:MAG: helix-turn-helix transcriptional regulator [Flavobacteriaceae bacterium]|nr:helix-turn-helix transcriptional regulator [Flavobacteriaceae bacterium]
MNINVFFGEKIREERLSQGLSQERLALLADIDRTYMSDIENGGRKVSLEVSYKLSKALCIPLSNLLKNLK